MQKSEKDQLIHTQRQWYIILYCLEFLEPRYNKKYIHRDKYSGCSVHYVTSKLDSGKLILQKKVKINKKETENTLKQKILKQEHKLYPRAIKKILD